MEGLLFFYFYVKYVGGMAKEKSIKELEDLPGIGAATAEKLRASGYDKEGAWPHIDRREIPR